MPLVDTIKNKFESAKELGGELNTFRRAIAENDGTPKPTELWLPEYYDKSPEELFAGPLKFEQDNFDLALRAARFVAPRVAVYGTAENLKLMGSEPAVWVLNHQDFADPVVVGMVAQLLEWVDPRYAAMAELFDKDIPKLAHFFASIGAIPLDRALMLDGKLKPSAHFIRMADFILSEIEESFVVFAEGRIEDKPKGYAHKVGVVGELPMRIAKRNKVPLVVAGIAGTRGAGTRAFNPFARTDVGVCVREVYGPDELPTPLQLRTSMTHAAAIAISVAKEN